MSGPALSFRDLACGHRGRPVLTGLAGSVAPETFVGLLGPNGVGKSTLLATLAGLLPPLGGEVRLGDATVSGLSAREQAQRRAFLPQHPPVELDWRVEDVVAIGRFAHQAGWGLRPGVADREAVAQAMRAADVAELAERRLATLSGGQRQRVHLARALAQEAPILFLDEPTTHLDLTHQLAFYRLVRELVAERGLTVLAVLHDLNLAAQYCHRLLLLGPSGEGGPGALLADGPPEAVLVPGLVARVFGQAVQVRYQAETGLPYVLPALADAAGTARPPGWRGEMHVVCGGGSGERLLPALLRAGYGLSVGVVNALDSDEQLAERLGLAVVCEAPFSPVGGEARAALAARLQAVADVVVAEVAWGSGNVENLRAVLACLQSPAPPRVWLLGGDAGVADRDFTGGEATELAGRLLRAGAVPVAPGALLAGLGI